MLKISYSIVFTFLFSFFLFVNNSNSQNILTHSTGTLTMSIYDNSYIGHNFSATTGQGVIFTGGVDAMYTAGFVAGYSVTRTVGLVGSFTSGGVPTMQDWLTTVPFGSFSSNANFNQISVSTYTDGSAPAPNQVGLSVRQTSLSNTNDDFVFLHYEITNTSGSQISGLYAGIFADWDVGLNNYLLNRGGYDVARNLAYQYENGGAADTRYYGLVALSGLAGARVTTNSAFGGAVPVRDSTFHWISTFMNETITTNGDYRSLIGSGPYNLAIGQSITVGFAVVAGVDLADLQFNAETAQNKWNNIVVPVELTSFTASVNPSGQVVLNWATATELNNRIFEIERRPVDGQFITIGFVEGRGTTTQPQEYSYTDNSVAPGSYAYRLKQIDFDGQHEYFDEIMVDVPPMDFSLSQNYPNPFNPTTNIKFNLAVATTIKLSVFNLLGEEIRVLVDEFREAGFYDVTLDASSLPSGTYFYKIETPQFTQTKKMILTK